MKGIPGASIEVAQEDGGPPTDPPVNIEVAGDNFENIASVASQLYNYLDTNRVEGIENLQPDVDLNNPEITINVDRRKSNDGRCNNRPDRYGNTHSGIWKRSK